MSYDKELLKGNTNTLLLALIRERPMYGYQLVKELERRSDGYFRFREGTLYPALHRLERAGLISGRWEKAANGQERRYYHLTAGGQQFLEAKLAEWQGFSRAINLVMGPAQV